MDRFLDLWYDVRLRLASHCFFFVCFFLSLKVSLKEGFTPSKKEQLALARKSNILDKMPARTNQQQQLSNNADAAAAPALPPVSIERG